MTTDARLDWKVYSTMLIRLLTSRCVRWKHFQYIGNRGAFMFIHTGTPTSSLLLLPFFSLRQTSHYVNDTSSPVFCFSSKPCALLWKKSQWRLFSVLEFEINKVAVTVPIHGLSYSTVFLDTYLLSGLLSHIDANKPLSRRSGLGHVLSFGQSSRSDGVLKGLGCICLAVIYLSPKFLIF